MSRIKIDYGIDLGTTNSAIARMENGEVKIIKSDTQKDTTPSCVHFKKNGILLGDPAYARYGDDYMAAFKSFIETGKKQETFNTFIEFKRTMGSDKAYVCNNLTDKSFSSEDLSAEVLKGLKSYVRDEDIPAVVITVPAKFRNNQIDATQKAAELAGFKYCELLQEPIAASIAYGVSANSVHGYWLVFDFGGGTFDAALMKVDEGIMKVVDTDGDNHLGGKDLDFAIVDNIIIPYLKQNYNIKNILNDDFGFSSLRESLKSIAEEAKILISSPSKTSADISSYKPIGDDDDGKEIEIDIRMTLEDYESAVSPIFNRAIDITKKLIERNNLKPVDLEMILLVGGPTLSQTLRNKLNKELNVKLNTSIDPMTSVAMGAALYASTRSTPGNLQTKSLDKLQLTLKYDDTTVEDEVEIGIKIDKNQSAFNSDEKLFVEITRSDRAWSSGKILIEGGAEILTLQLNKGKSNGFNISLYTISGNLIPCEPSSINIIQGFKEPPATLPWSIGVEAFSIDNNRAVFNEIPGLRKNQSLPAKGKDSFKTQKDIRPGNKEDKITIRIFEGDYNSNGTRAILNELASEIEINGDDLSKFLPKDSEVEITLEVDRSRRITFKAFFPEIDETFEKGVETNQSKEIDYSKLLKEIDNGKMLLIQIEQDAASIDLSLVSKIRDEFSLLETILDNGKSDFNTKTNVMERLRQVLKSIDKLEEESTWPTVEENLNKVLDELRVTNERYGNEQTSKALQEFERLSTNVIRSMDIKSAKDLTAQISSFEFSIYDQGTGVALDISFIKNFDDNFDTFQWTNKNDARQLINQAKQIISTNPTKSKLRPIVIAIYQLVPGENLPPSFGNDKDILTK
jgi:molecular chaperone DnaK